MSTKYRRWRNWNPKSISSHICGEGNGNHSSILAWKIPRTEEPSGATVHGVTKESDEQTTNITNNKKEMNKQQMETTNTAEYLPLKNHSVDYKQFCQPEKAMAPHSSILAWKIPWMEKPGGLQSMGSLRVRHDWATSLSLFTFMHCRRKWQPTAVFLPGESQGQRSLVGCHLWGRTELDTTEVT